MIIKQCQFFGRTDEGVFCQTLFGSSGVFEKIAGAPAFSDWETGDDLRNFISRISKEDRHKNAYVLVNALGAGEFFGSNINADFFPWDALAHDGDDYGHKTFLAAHAFQHHKNKDPSRAFGTPVLSLLNPTMKRVELVIKLDRAKAALEGATPVIEKIDRGEFPDVSMGCKVPYDICSICGHRSKTRLDYCQHMNPSPEMRGVYGPNKILPDGQRICVLNTLPRFFDLSFVFIGADKTAKVMAKLASQGNQLCIGDVCAIPRLSSEVYELTTREKTASCDCSCGTCGSLDKTAAAGVNEKTSSQLKTGDIIKNIPVGALSAQGIEPNISDEKLERLTSHSLSNVASTAGMMGIVLKPAEFQKLVLVKMSEAALAKKLEASGTTFREVSEINDSILVDANYYDTKVAGLLMDVVKDRTAFGDNFNARLVKASAVKKTLPTGNTLAHPLLDKISAAYNGYRRNLLSKVSQAVGVIEGDPALREKILGNVLVNMFTKTASHLITPNSMQYLMGAYYSDSNLLNNIDVADATSIDTPA